MAALNCKSTIWPPNHIRRPVGLSLTLLNACSYIIFHSPPLLNQTLSGNWSKFLASKLLESLA